MAIRRAFVLALVLLAVLAFSMLPALATEGETEPPASTPTETTAGEAADGMEPAVPVEPEAPEEASQDWTYRYMIPTGIVLGVIVIVATSAQYFTSVVRKRYRIVEE
jgi:hypothetical protein